MKRITPSYYNPTVSMKIGDDDGDSNNNNDNNNDNNNNE